MYGAAVRVINCDSTATSSAVIAGLEWLAQNVQLPAVASLSLGSDNPNQALDDAVSAVVALGVTAVVAAGNYNQGGLPQLHQSYTHYVSALQSLALQRSCKEVHAMQHCADELSKPR